MGGRGRRVCWNHQDGNVDAPDKVQCYAAIRVWRDFAAIRIIRGYAGDPHRADPRPGPHRGRGDGDPGIGHRFHKPIDPRAPKLFEIAAANGFSGKYVALMNAVARHAEQSLGKSLPVNATGADLF